MTQDKRIVNSSNSNNNSNKNNNNKKRTLDNTYTNKFQFLESGSDDSEKEEAEEEMKRIALKKKKKSNNNNNTNNNHNNLNSSTSIQQLLKETENKFKLESDGVLDNLNVNKPTFTIQRKNCTIKDIQNYILWLKLRFKVPTPNWIFTTMSPLIEKVVVVSIQGLSQLMFDKLCLLSGRELFSSVFLPDNKVELQLTNYNHIFENLLSIKSHKVQKIDNPEIMKKEIEPRSFYLLSEEQMIENGYFGIKDLKEGWVYSNQVQSIVDILKPSSSESDSGSESEKDGASNYNDKLNKLNETISELLAIDCEMCRTEGGELELTRISIINEKKKVLLNEFVLTERPIIDYLTQYSGITAETLTNVTTTLSDIHVKLNKIITKDTVLMGHSLENDLRAMKFIHRKIIDTAILYPTGSSGKFPLKYLTKKYLNRIIQNKKSGHDSIEDAKAVMDLVLIKIQKGKSFGTKLESYENLFDKIHKYDLKSSFIDQIDDIKTYTTPVVSCFNCDSDGEVIEKTIKQSQSTSSSDLVCCQLSALNEHFKSLEQKPFSFTQPEKNKPITTTTTTTSAMIEDSPLLSEKEIKEIHSLDGIEINSTVKSIVYNMEQQIKKLYDRLQDNTMLMLVIGPGPTNDINRFKNDGNKQNDYLLSIETAKEGYTLLALK